MSIIVRGMEMPQNCDKCRFQSAFKLYCDAMPYNFCGNTDDIERPDWCPLVEIPPHGRLIDVNKLNIHDVSPAYGFCVMGVTEEDIELSETVIEAEE